MNTNSTEFKQGVEAGLNSDEGTKNWRAGHEPGRELREAGTGGGAGHDAGQ